MILYLNEKDKQFDISLGDITVAKERGWFSLWPHPVFTIVIDESKSEFPLTDCDFIITRLGLSKDKKEDKQIFGKYHVMIHPKFGKEKKETLTPTHTTFQLPVGIHLGIWKWKFELKTDNGFWTRELQVGTPK
jgi:hypothetical protein